jgi:hypothetical protein
VKTQQQHGGRAALLGLVSSSTGSFSMRGQMAFDAEGRGKATLTVPPHGDLDHAVKVREVVDGTTVYFSSPAFGSLPDGSKWMSIDLLDGHEPSSPVPADGDAKGELELLEEATGKVEKLDSEEVRGVPTTHYRGTIGVARQVERAREYGDDELASILEKYARPAQVEAWIDDEGLIRRMRIVQRQPAHDGEEPATLDMRMDFFDFGLEPEIDVPDSSEVFDATDLAREDLQAGHGARGG